MANEVSKLYKELDTKPNTENLTFEESIKKIKSDIDIIELLHQNFVKGMNTEQSLSKMKELVNVSAIIETNKIVVEEIKKMSQEFENDIKTQNRELNDLIEQMLLAVMNYLTKAMTKEDKIKALAPYNLKYSNLIAKIS